MTDRLKPGFCQHCGAECSDRFGSEIYPHRPELASKVIWCCPFCDDSRVGTHEDGKDKGKPLGTAANPDLRSARVHVHGLLDPLWKEAHRDYPDAHSQDQNERIKALSIIKRTARKRVYEFLADHMGLSREDCHVACMSIEECRVAYRFLRGKTYADVRTWAKQQEPPENKSNRRASGS